MENYHLTKAGDLWHLTLEGAARPAKAFPSKQSAVDGSAEYLNGRTASLKIHGEDGRIQEERTYPRSADPGETPG